jgi:hypothetical protein
MVYFGYYHFSTRAIAFACAHPPFDTESALARPAAPPPRNNPLSLPLSRETVRVALVVEKHRIGYERGVRGQFLAGF